MRTRAKVDLNQKAITAELRKRGASVQVLSTIGKGCPDLLVGFRGKNFLFEIKQNEKKSLTTAEQNWFDRWAGDADRINSVEEALVRIGASVKTFQAKT